MLRFRGLVGADEAGAYHRAYLSITGYEVDRDFLSRTRLYGAFDRRGNLRAGFVANTEAPFRYLERIPDDARAVVSAKFDLEQVMELTCVWMDRRLRSGPCSFVFWTWMFLVGSRLGKPLVIFGTEVPGLRRLYEAGRPVTIYEGPVRIDGTETYGWIYSNPVARRWRYLALVMRHKALRPLRRRLEQSATTARGRVVEPLPASLSDHGSRG